VIMREHQTGENDRAGETPDEQLNFHTSIPGRQRPKSYKPIAKGLESPPKDWGRHRGRGKFRKHRTSNAQHRTSKDERQKAKNAGLCPHLALYQN
jgi:hypothetical protein